jgi:hypothetical protein
MIRANLSKYRLFLLVLFYGYASAQSYKNKAKIDSVSQSGFYAIHVTPALSSLVKTDFSDLRIIDNKGNPIPYLLGSDIPMLDSARFMPLKILKNFVSDSGQSILIIENIPDGKMDGFYIRMKNAAVSRTISLSGSNDAIKWYSIVENIDLEKRFIQDHDSFQEFISLPLSSYRYFSVIIYNGKNDPLDIISAQKRIQTIPAEKYDLVKNPSNSFTSKDSSKITWLAVDNSRKFHISNVLFQVKTPRFYKRQVDVIVGGILAGNFIISSDSVVNLNLPAFNDSVFTIKIYNEDNPPLEITDLSTAQNDERIITYLESGKTYEFEMTSADASFPHYDLVSFKDSIPKEIKEIGFSGISNIPSVVKVSDSYFKQAWLWPALIFALIVLCLFTYRLTKDVAKRP